MASNGFMELVNKSISPLFNNTNEYDMAIYTESSNQAIHLGCGFNQNSNSMLTITNSNIQISSHLLPTSNETYDLGSETARFRDLYLSGNTINMAGTKLSIDQDNNLQIKDTNDNLRKLIVDEIQLGSSAQSVRIKKDEATGGFKFTQVQEGIEVDDDSIGGGGVKLTNVVPETNPTTGHFTANVATVPTLDFLTVPQKANVTYGRVVLGAHNGVSLYPFGSLSTVINHNLGTPDYFVYATPEDATKLQVGTSNYTPNAFSMTVRNTTNAQLLNPAINYQIIQAARTTVTRPIVPPVSIANPRQTLNTYSGPSSTFKAIPITGVSDPLSFPITYSVISNDLDDRPTISNNQQLVYNHGRQSTIGQAIILAQNPYNPDESATITYDINETRIDPPSITTAHSIITYTASNKQPRTFANLTPSDQGLPIVYSLSNSGGTDATLSPNGQTIEFKSQAASATRTIRLKAGFSNWIMSEANLTESNVTIDVTERFLTPIPLAACNYTISNYSSRQQQQRTFSNLPLTSQFDLPLTYTLSNSNGLSNVALNPNGFLFTTHGQSHNRNVTLRAAYDDQIMQESGLSNTTFNVNVREIFLTQPTIPNTFNMSFFAGSTPNQARKFQGLPASNQAVPLVYSISNDMSNLSASITETSNIAFLTKGTPATRRIVLQAGFPEYIMREADLPYIPINLDITELSIGPISIAQNYEQVIYTSADTRSLSREFPLPSTNQESKLFYTTPASLSGLTAYSYSNDSVVKFTAPATSATRTLSFAAKFADNVMNEGGLTQLPIALKIVQSNLTNPSITLANQTIYSGPTRAGVRQYIMPTQNQNLNVLYTVPVAGTMSANITNGNTLNFTALGGSTGGTSTPRTVDIKINFANNIMQEAWLAQQSILLTITEIYMTNPSLTTKTYTLPQLYASPERVAAGTSYTFTNAGLLATQQNNALNYEVTGTNPLNAFFSGVTMTYYPRNSSTFTTTGAAITFSASVRFANNIMTEANLAQDIITFNVTQSWINTVYTENFDLNYYTSAQSKSKSVNLPIQDANNNNINISYAVPTTGVTQNLTSLTIGGSIGTNPSATWTTQTTGTANMQTIYYGYIDASLSGVTLSTYGATAKRFSITAREFFLTPPVLSPTSSTRWYIAYASISSYGGNQGSFSVNLPSQDNTLYQNLTWAINSNTHLTATLSGNSLTVGPGPGVYNTSPAGSQTGGTKTVSLRASFPSSIVAESGVYATTYTLTVKENCWYPNYGEFHFPEPVSFARIYIRLPVNELFITSVKGISTSTYMNANNYAVPSITAYSGTNGVSLIPETPLSQTANWSYWMWFRDFVNQSSPGATITNVTRININFRHYVNGADQGSVYLLGISGSGTSDVMPAISPSTYLDSGGWYIDVMTSNRTHIQRYPKMS